MFYKVKKMTDIITANKLTKIYKLYDSPSDRLKETFNFRGKQFHRDFYALQNISFSIQRGRTIGIVGRNGAGKSTLLKILTGVLTPNAGEYHVNGKVSSLLELGAGFNFDLTGYENIYFNGAVLGYTKKEMDEKIDEIIEFAEIGDFINQKVKTYSSGMFVRLAFSVAISVNPDVLIVDEALAVGDELFQRKCYSRIRQLKEAGTTIVLVSHGTNVLTELCDELILLDHGELILRADPKYVIAKYQKLLYAFPEKREEIRNEIILSGKKTRSIDNDDASKAEQIINEDENEIGDVFDPDFISKSIQSYTPKGCEILNPQITTLDGKQVNHLFRRNKYKFEYHVKFKSEVKNIRFGMLIKNLTGVELGGKTTAHEEQGIEIINQGENLKVSFTFDCFLQPGTYFINAGVSGELNGEYTMLHRVLDALVFKVVSTGRYLETMMIDFNIEHEIKQDQI